MVFLLPRPSLWLDISAPRFSLLALRSPFIFIPVFDPVAFYILSLHSLIPVLSSSISIYHNQPYNLDHNERKRERPYHAPQLAEPPPLHVDTGNPRYTKRTRIPILTRLLVSTPFPVSSLASGLFLLHPPSYFFITLLLSSYICICVSCQSLRIRSATRQVFQSVSFITITERSIDLSLD